jgi:hypothetical protein
VTITVTLRGYHSFIFEAVYQQQYSEYVQTNLAYFDFTGDGAITTADVEALYAEVTGA